MGVKHALTERTGDRQHDPVDTARELADKELALARRDREARVAGERGDLVGTQPGAIERLLGAERVAVRQRDRDGVAVDRQSDHPSARPDATAERDRRLRVGAGQPERVDDAFVRDVHRTHRVRCDIWRLVSEPAPVDELDGHAVRPRQRDVVLEPRGLLRCPREHQRATGQ